VTVARRAIDKVYAAFEGVATGMSIGGEPTLSEEIIEFACRYATAVAAKKGAAKPEFCMISNGVRMSDRLFELIREFEIQVTFSVDGPKKVNDLVRIRHDNSGSFDAVVQTIQRYRRYCRIRYRRSARLLRHTGMRVCPSPKCWSSAPGTWASRSRTSPAPVCRRPIR
jgi:uncharacterized protein